MMQENIYTAEMKVIFIKYKIGPLSLCKWILINTETKIAYTMFGIKLYGQCVMFRNDSNLFKTNVADALEMHEVNTPKLIIKDTI